MPIVQGRFNKLLRADLEAVWNGQRVPASEWQAWKDRNAPMWFLRLFPVKWKKVPDEYSPLV